MMRATGKEPMSTSEPILDGPMQGHNAPCCKCGELCSALAADPGRWPLILVPVWRDCEPGVTEVHCSRCVHEMMVASRRLRAMETALDELFDGPPQVWSE